MALTTADIKESDWDPVIGEYSRRKPITVFIDRYGIGSSVGGYDSTEHPTDAIPMSDEIVRFTQDLLQRVDNQFGLSFQLVDTIGADIDFHLTPSDPVGSDYAGRAYYTWKEEWGVTDSEWTRTGWEKKRKRNGKIKRKPVYGYKDTMGYSTEVNTDITLHGNSNAMDLSDPDEYWKNLIVHELGHAIGLEHPFDTDDGDSYGTEDSTNKWETSMAYGPANWELGYDKYPDYFSSLDQQALYEIFGAA